MIQHGAAPPANPTQHNSPDDGTTEGEQFTRRPLRPVRTRPVDVEEELSELDRFARAVGGLARVAGGPPPFESKTHVVELHEQNHECTVCGVENGSVIDKMGKENEPGTVMLYLEGVGVLVGRDHTEPLAHLVLLEELLGQVLEVPLGEGDARGNRKLSRSLAGDLDIVSELSNLSLDLDLVDKELLVRGGVEDLVVGGAGEVNHKPDE